MWLAGASDKKHKLDADVPVNEPWPRVVRLEADGNIVCCVIADGHNVANDWVFKVVR